jgi:hypothetical protein
MATLHETSHDCRRYARRHGGRRRLCGCCGHSWTVHKRRPGRRRRRISCSLPRMVLVEHEPVKRLSVRRRCSRDSVYRRIRQALGWLVRQPPSVAVPAAVLVLVVDGLWFTFQRREWALYTMALRPVAADRAYFLDPVMLPGKECGRRWRQALAATLDSGRRRQICALVADGFHGAAAIAAEGGWAFQDFLPSSQNPTGLAPTSPTL